LSGAADGKICAWDVQAVPRGEVANAVSPKAVFSGAHAGSVEAVEWSPIHEAMFASVGDDGMAFLWDHRETSPVGKIAAHNGEGRAVAYNHYNEHLLATGGEDKIVALCDLRKADAALARLTGHADEVTCVEWSPFHEDVLVSGSLDRRAHVWDLSRPVEDGKALAFVHAGHRGAVLDVSWNQHDPWTVASVSQDASLHVWRPSERLLA